MSSKDKRIWVYERGSSKPFPSTEKSIANENNYYSPEIEAYLANAIETPANAVLKKIKKREQISDDDREKLAIYMINMINRVPQSKVTMKKMMPKSSKKLLEKYENDIAKLKLKNQRNSDSFEKRLNEIRKISEKITKNIPKDLWLNLVKPSSMPNALEKIYQMTWLFLTFDDYPAFFTCDNPVFFFKDIGIGAPESEITFPISSNIVLWATWRTDLNEGYSKIKSAVFKEINRRTVNNTTRFLYSAKKEFWIQKFVNKQHQLKRLNMREKGITH